ncbi:EF-hand domain-containing protein, partial [Burkholderia multivorans]
MQKRLIVIAAALAAAGVALSAAAFAQASDA